MPIRGATLRIRAGDWLILKAILRIKAGDPGAPILNTPYSTVVAIAQVRARRGRTVYSVGTARQRHPSRYTVALVDPALLSLWARIHIHEYFIFIPRVLIVFIVLMKSLGLFASLSWPPAQRRPKRTLVCNRATALAFCNWDTSG